MTSRVRVAAVQAEPRWLDLSAGVDQVIALIEAASDQGARLVAFPETFVPGFPWWMWLPAVQWDGDILARYHANSMAADGPELRAIRYAARRRRIHVGLGFSERADKGAYMSQALIDDEGAMAVSRKALPTALERTVFGTAVRRPLVRDTTLGRIGVLGGTDHFLPGVCEAMHQAGEHIHVASWPGFTVARGGTETDVEQLSTAACRRYARASRSYLIAPTAVVPLPGWQAADAGRPDVLHGRSGVARILGPDGRDLATPLAPDEEGLLVADLIVATAAAHRPASPATDRPASPGADRALA
ncbi:nitrilase-related carbon-nitrogen hydrolase [Nocardia neocaledoniensis]|uniref:nitrilase-related carbon-nitrogen hydrolase n=1 Tax=Nocardia neocaledoniensis TaxID=236511 RepID=UPI00245472CA|nr:nitrilase-related carbon-nitrogen hydrolase [Nocardia neocaledoniensis]